MRLRCPHCGERGNEEFSYLGAAGLHRPAPDVPTDPAWHEYVYLRDNPAGPNRELWQHTHGCRRWLVVVRNTVTHMVDSVADA